MHTSLDDFLSKILYPTPEGTDYVFCVLTDPPSDDKPWPPIREEALSRKLRNPKAAAYISIMISNNGRNKQSSFAGLSMIVLDDIGTKVTTPPSLEPTYKIETSKGNEQWGYVFQEPIFDKAEALRIANAVYATDYTDKGGRLLNKFVRLPAGINGKDRNGTIDTFPVTLTAFSGVYYTPEQLIDGLDLVPTAPASTTLSTAPIVTPKGITVPADKVLTWLENNGLVASDTGGDFIDIICPWHEEHSEGTKKTAGYSPIGRGDKDHRGFKCFHEHCRDRKTPEFLEWVHQQKGPKAQVYDLVAVLTSTYVLLEHSTEVADITAKADRRYPITRLSGWKAAHQMLVPDHSGEKFKPAADMWLQSRDIVRCKGKAFVPGENPLLDDDGDILFNTYRAPSHPMIRSPALAQHYLDHISWLIPDPGECALFHDWIARKLQQPKSRSYALVLVADLLEGEQGHRYGTGRSITGDILGRVFQSGIAKLDLEDVIGKGNSQTVYNDWADGTLLAIIEETKEAAGSWRDDYANYEGIKKVIDIRPIPGTRVKPKYGMIYETTLYANFLFFSNHSDAFQLPEDDRRLAVLNCNKGRRKPDEYQRLRDTLDDKNAIAAIYHWYMSRDIANHDPIYPPMTPAKKRMVAQAENALDEVWTAALDMLKGDVVTKKQLIEACKTAAIDDDDLHLKAPAMARQRWRKLARIDTLNDRQQVSINSRPYVVRNLRNLEAVAKAVGEHGPKALQEHLELNEKITNML